MEISQLKQILKMYDIWPSKGKGQNFLIDESVLEQIVQAADLKATDKVLEIGPGLGVLTEKLIKTAGTVLAVELDKKILTYLQTKFIEKKNLKIIEGDILKIKNQEISDQLGVGYKVVANIPYNITSPIIQKFLTYEPKPTELVLLVQKEVAQRICAQAGDMSILAVSVQMAAQPEIVGYVSKEYFWPVPEVDSAILKLRIKGVADGSTGLTMTATHEKEFFRIVKIGFSARRKKLYNNLSAGLKISTEQAKDALKQAGIGEDVRPQDLSIENWLNLVASLTVTT